MKIKVLKIAGMAFAVLFITSNLSQAQEQPAAKQALSPEAQAKADAEIDKKATEWISSLALNDTAKASRVKNVVATHLKAIRDWNNSHSYESVPAGIDPATGKPLSTMDRQIIINSSLPKSVHENLMTGLRKDLNEEQVEAILDKYTIGKVAFTLAGYKAIVTDLTPVEEVTILANLKQAREQAVDFKNIKQISAIFEIYKTKNEQYLNANGRNWHQLFKGYVDAVKAKKTADAAAKKQAQ
jgi:hypothetical protein